MKLKVIALLSLGILASSGAIADQRVSQPEGGGFGYESVPTLPPLPPPVPMDSTRTMRVIERAVGAIVNSPVKPTVVPPGVKVTVPTGTGLLPPSPKSGGWSAGTPRHNYGRGMPFFRGSDGQPI